MNIYKRKNQEKFQLKNKTLKNVFLLEGECGRKIILPEKHFNDLFCAQGDFFIYRENTEPYYEVIDKVINDNGEISAYILRNNIGSLLKINKDKFYQKMEAVRE